MHGARATPRVELVLTDDEREQLERWSRRRKSSQALALRFRIVLACAAGADSKTVAVDVKCAQATVGKWRARFVEQRLDGLTDDDRPGRPILITLDVVASDSPRGLVAMHAPEQVVTLVRSDVDPVLLSGLPGVVGVDVQGNRLHVRTEDPNALLKGLLDAGASLREISVSSPSLDTVFRRLTGTT